MDDSTRSVSFAPPHREPRRPLVTAAVLLFAVACATASDDIGTTPPDSGTDGDIHADAADVSDDDAAVEDSSHDGDPPDLAGDAGDDVAEAADDGGSDADDVPDDGDAGDDVAEAADDVPDGGDGGDAGDAEPSPYYRTSFSDIDCARWTTGRASSGGVDDWQCGSGTGDPDSGHDAEGGVLATRIGADYSLRSNGFAESPAIDTGPGTGPLRLRLWHWMETEGRDTDCTGSSGDNDGGLVAVSTGGGPYTTSGVEPFDGYPCSSIDAWFGGGPAFVDGQPGFACRSGRPRPPPPAVAWEQVCFDISAFRAPDLRIRLYFGSDAFVVARGWYVDELSVEDGTCPW